VVEFDAGVRVQRGSVTFDNGAVQTVALPQAVRLDQAFPLVSAAIGGTDLSEDDLIRARFTDSGAKLELSNLGLATGTVQWQTVEMANTRVQSGDLSFADAGGRAVLSRPVDRSRAWLVYHYTAHGSSPKQLLIRGRLADASTVELDRDVSAPETVDATWYVVEFTDGTQVQSGNASWASGDAVKNVALGSPIPMSRSFAAGGYEQRGGKTSFGSSDDVGHGWFKLALSPTELHLERASTGSTADLAWWVITFP
jgi:hypothetical protein